MLQGARKVRQGRGGRGVPASELAKSRFLHSAVASAPTPVGMTNGVVASDRRIVPLAYDYGIMTMIERMPAMKKMAAGEFKVHCLAVMDEVQSRREAVLITKRGKPVAKLVPAD